MKKDLRRFLRDDLGLSRREIKVIAKSGTTMRLPERTSKDEQAKLTAANNCPTRFADAGREDAQTEPSNEGASLRR